MPIVTRNAWEERTIPMTTEQHIKVRVISHFSASPERVFDAWLDPEMIGRWMFGPALRDEEVVRVAVDSRVGGSFSFVVRRQGKEIDHVGEYLEIVRPRRLVFTWGVKPLPDGSHVIIDIAPIRNWVRTHLDSRIAPGLGGLRESHRGRLGKDTRRVGCDAKLKEETVQKPGWASACFSFRPALCYPIQTKKKSVRTFSSTRDKGVPNGSCIHTRRSVGCRICGSVISHHGR